MVQVITRAGDMLAAFSESTPVRTLGECAAHAKITKSSAHRILMALEGLGLVERDESASWRIGAGALRLAAIRLSHRSVKDEVIVGLRPLGQKFEAATAYSVPNGPEMVYVERTASPLPYAPAARLGSIAPIWFGASGWAVLSRMTPDERSKCLNDPDWLALSAKLRKQILKEIDRAATLGYAVDEGRFFDNIAGVAVAVGSSGYPSAAASLIIAPNRMSTGLITDMGNALQELVHNAIERTSIGSSTD